MGRTTRLCVVFGVILGACGGDDGAPVDPDATSTVEPDANADTDAPTTSASHVPGVYRVAAVTLTSDEPATIHYTTDGSTPTTASPGGSSPLTVDVAATATLRFFAVDAAGNEETTQELALVIDRLGPVGIPRLTAAAGSTDVNLTWANPTDAGFTRTVIARVTDLSTTVPVDGTDHALNDMLGTARIIYAGSGTAFSDVGRGPGHHTYVAWAQYDTGVYSEGRAAAVRIATPTQSCEIAIANVTAGGTPSVSVQAPNFGIAISNYANAGGSITFDVKMTSGLAGIAFNPKLVFTSVAGTGATPTITNATGTVTIGSPSPYFYFGPQGLRSGASATRRVAVSANGASAITLGCRIVEDPGLFYSIWNCPTELTNTGGIVDVRTQTDHNSLPHPGRYAEHTPQRRAPSSACSHWQSLVLSPDQRYLYAGPRANKVVAKIDTTTMSPVALLDVQVAGVSASAGKLALDPSGRRLYVGVNDGGHGGGHAGGSAGVPSSTSAVENLVLEVATATMSETSRVEVGSGDSLHRLVRAVLSPDGRRMGVAIGAMYQATPNNELHFYDTSTWAELDTDTVTAGIQPFDIGTLRASTIAFDGTGRYAVIGVGGVDTAAQFGVVDLEALSIQMIDSPIPTGDRRVVSANWDVAAFWLWTSDQTQLFRLIPATGAITPGSPFGQTISQPKEALRVGDTLYLLAGNGTFLLNATTGAVQTTLPRPRNLHSLAMTR